MIGLVMLTINKNPLMVFDVRISPRMPFITTHLPTPCFAVNER